MSRTLLCDTHQPHHTLISNFRAAPIGDFLFAYFPIAILQTTNWSRIVIYPLYKKRIYPAEYYQNVIKIYHI